MSNENYNQILSVLTSFTDIPVSELLKIQRIFRPATVLKDSYFVTAGKLPSQVGFVMSGLLRSYFITQTGDEYTMSFFIENDFVASHSASILKKESKIFIQALENTSLLTANFRDYYDLLESHPCWQIVGRKLAEASFLKKELREIELLADVAETRYLKFLNDYPNIEKRVRQHYIASYLGITPVSLSRIRAKLHIEDKIKR